MAKGQSSVFGNSLLPHFLLGSKGSIQQKKGHSDLTMTSTQGPERASRLAHCPVDAQMKEGAGRQVLLPPHPNLQPHQAQEG